MVKKKLTIEEKYHNCLLLLRQSYIHNDLLSRHLYMVLKRIYDEDEDEIAEDIKKIENSFVKKEVPKTTREIIEEETRNIYSRELIAI